MSKPLASTDDSHSNVLFNQNVFSLAMMNTGTKLAQLNKLAKIKLNLILLLFF